jgi:ribosome-associated protein
MCLKIFKLWRIPVRNDVFINDEIVIPDYEIEITTSRAGGPGGQHVNKTESRITIRWNVKTTTVLTEEQKERVLKNLQTRLTSDGDLIIHCGTARSQVQNKEMALDRLAQEVRKGLHVPKKRMATRVPKSVKEARLQEKKRRSMIKKDRGKKHHDE